MEINAQRSENDNNPTPSIFRLNLLEIIFGILFGVLLILSFRNTVLSMQAFGTPGYGFSNAKADLISDLSWTFFPTGFLAGVAFIRMVRRQNHLVPLLGQISPRGYLILTWPIFLMLPEIQLIFVLSLTLSFPIVMLVSVVIYGFSKRQYDSRGDLLSVLLNFLGLIPFVFYILRVWELIGY